MRRQEMGLGEERLAHDRGSRSQQWAGVALFKQHGVDQSILTQSKMSKRSKPRLRRRSPGSP